MYFGALKIFFYVRAKNTSVVELKITVTGKQMTTFQNSRKMKKKREYKHIKTQQWLQGIANGK